MSASTTTLRCLAITGPTACGKTDLALALADEFPVEIISMDSAMVYRGLDIGTAKPDSEIRQRVAHHLVDICDPEETYSAGSFATDARAAIEAINARDRVALIVGGTMLYLRALRSGIAKLPERDPAIRSRIDARARDSGWAVLHQELAQVDPAAAARIEPGDRQRIQRALEVHAITGRSLSELQQGAPGQGLSIPAVAIMPPDRKVLSQAIEKRFDAMLEAGLVAEVRELRQRPQLTADCPSMRAVGYRQLWAWLDGELTFAEARERAIIATRQLAKRQLTWLRGDSLSEPLSADFSTGLSFLRERVKRAADDA